MITWLRPFNLAGYPTCNFQEVLTLAAADVAKVVTLKDGPTFDSKPQDSKHGQFEWSALLTAGILIIYIVNSARKLAEAALKAEAASVVCVGAVMLEIGLRFTRYLSNRERSFSRIGMTFKNDIERALESEPQGIRVIQCPDSLWKPAVQTCLQLSVAVILDLTQVSSNLSWEIQESLKVVGSHRMIVACRCADGLYPTSTPDHILEALGTVNSDECAIFFYPPPELSLFGEKVLAKELRSIIIGCLKDEGATTQDLALECQFCGWPAKGNKTSLDEVCPKCCGPMFPISQAERQ